MSELLFGDRDGATYDHDFDFERLNKQMKKVYLVMKDGEWRTLSELSAETGSPEASVSARLRDLRKVKFGAFTVERRRITDSGLYEYRVCPKPEIVII